MAAVASCILCHSLKESLSITIRLASEFGNLNLSPIRKVHREMTGIAATGCRCFFELDYLANVDKTTKRSSISTTTAFFTTKVMV